MNGSTNIDNVTKIPKNNWIYNYLDSVHPEKLKNIKNRNELMITLLESIQNSGDILVLNNIILKVYSKCQNDENRKGVIHRHLSKKAKKLQFKTKIRQNLLSYYCSICHDLHGLTNDLMAYVASMNFKYENETDLNFVRVNLEGVAVKSMISRVLSIKKQFRKICKIKSENNNENIIINHMKQECRMILKKLIGLLLIWGTKTKTIGNGKTTKEKSPIRKYRAKNIFSICKIHSERKKISPDLITVFHAYDTNKNFAQYSKNIAGILKKSPVTFPKCFGQQINVKKLQNCIKKHVRFKLKDSSQFLRVNKNMSMKHDSVKGYENEDSVISNYYEEEKNGRSVSRKSSHYFASSEFSSTLPSTSYLESYETSDTEKSRIRRRRGAGLYSAISSFGSVVQPFSI